jgi:hypothetical protein
MLETCLQYLERYKQQSVEAAVQYLDLVETLFNWLVTQSQRPAAAAAGGGGGGVDEEAALSGEWPTDWLQGRLARMSFSSPLCRAPSAAAAATFCQQQQQAAAA